VAAIEGIDRFLRSNPNAFIFPETIAQMEHADNDMRAALKVFDGRGYAARVRGGFINEEAEAADETLWKATDEMRPCLQRAKDIEARRAIGPDPRFVMSDPDEIQF
jgi:hypothetical protein